MMNAIINADRNRSRLRRAIVLVGAILTFVSVNVAGTVSTQAQSVQATTTTFLTTTIQPTTTTTSPPVVSCSDLPTSGPDYANFISADGRYVLYHSSVDQDPAYPSTGRQVFVVDRATGVRRLVSRKGATTSNQDSFARGITPDGRFVLFASRATNLDNRAVPPAFGVAEYLYRHDTQSGTTMLVSVSTSGAIAAPTEDTGSISDDGSIVMFDTTTSLVGAAHPANTYQVYVRNLTSGMTTIESRGAFAAGNNWSHSVRLSPDGRFILFRSRATNLAPGDLDCRDDVYVRDRGNNTTELISLNQSETSSADGDSWASDMTPDGRFVLFSSNAPDVDGSGIVNSYVRDRTLGTTTTVGRNPANTAAVTFGGALLSPDGARVLGSSSAGGLHPLVPDAGTSHVFVRDIVNHSTVLVDVSASGSLSNDLTWANALTGNTVVFNSEATNLLPEANVANRQQIYRATIPNTAGLPGNVGVASGLELVSRKADSTAVAGSGNYFSDISSDGASVQYMSGASDIPRAGSIEPGFHVIVQDLRPDPGARYHPVSPSRILDSRSTLGGWNAKLSSFAPKTLQVTGLGGASNVPPTATAVVLNVTVTGASAGSFVTAWPAGSSKPNSSNLNFGAGQTIPNLVTVKLGSGGKVAFANAVGTVHVIADVVGYYDNGIGPGDLFTGITQTRYLDSRGSTGGWSGPLSAGAPKDLVVRQPGLATGLPPTTTAVIANVTVTGGTSGSFVSVWPSGETQPNVSNLNFAAGETIPNLVIVKIGSGGSIRFANAIGDVHVIVDVVGYFDPSTGAQFHSMNPTRVLDDRVPTGLSGPWGPGQTRALAVAGATGTGVPAGAVGLIANVTATGGTQPSFITVFPEGVVRPNSSNVNFAAGQTIPNLVVVATGATGAINFYNKNGSVDIIADAVGYFSP